MFFQLFRLDLILFSCIHFSLVLFTRFSLSSPIHYRCFLFSDSVSCFLSSFRHYLPLHPVTILFSFHSLYFSSLFISLRCPSSVLWFYSSSFILPFYLIYFFSFFSLCLSILYPFPFLFLSSASLLSLLFSLSQVSFIILALSRSQNSPFLSFPLNSLASISSETFLSSISFGSPLPFFPFSDIWCTGDTLFLIPGISLRKGRMRLKVLIPGRF